MASWEIGENVEISHNKSDGEFVAVSRPSRKRKQQEESMDTTAVSMKKPHLPPLSGDKLLVCMWCFLLLTIYKNKNNVETLQFRACQFLKLLRLLFNRTLSSYGAHKKLCYLFHCYWCVWYFLWNINVRKLVCPECCSSSADRWTRQSPDICQAETAILHVFITHSLTNLLYQFAELFVNVSRQNWVRSVWNGFYLRS